MRSILHRLRLTLPVAFMLASIDCTTKELAADLLPAHLPHPILGDLLRFTLSFNPGAAMSLPVGPFPRPALLTMSLIILAVLVRLVWLSPPRARLQRIALGLIIGGAIGNLLSRVRFPLGVVDFIDVGVGMHRFYVFNVADVGVVCGAILLALTLSRTQAVPAQ